MALGAAWYFTFIAAALACAVQGRVVATAICVGASLAPLGLAVAWAALVDRIRGPGRR